MRFSIFLIVILFFQHFELIAQQPQLITKEYCSTDSLPNKIKQTLLTDAVAVAYPNVEPPYYYDKGIEQLRKLQECCQLINDESGYAEILIIIAYFQFEKKEYGEMKKELDKLSSIIDDLVFDDEENKLDIQSELAYLQGLYYDRTGSNEEALAFYQKSIDILLDLSGFYENGGVLNISELGKEFNYTRSYLFNNSAIIYLTFSDYDKALQNFGIVRDIIESDPYSSLEGNEGMLLVHNIFKTYVEMGDDKMARLVYAELMDLLPRMKNINYAPYIKTNSYRNMALHLFREGNDLEALKLLKKAEKENTGRVHLSAIYQLYSKIQLDTDIERSLESIDTAIFYAKKEWGEFHPEVAKNQMIKGDNYHHYDKYDLADIQYNLAINTLLRKEDENCNCDNIPILDLSEKRMGLNIINSKTENLAKSGKLDEALICYDLLHQLILELNNKFILNEESKYFFFQKNKNLYESAINTAIINNNKQKAYEFSQSSKSLILLQQVQDKYAKQAALIPDSILKEGEEIKIKINEIIKKKQKENLLKDKEDSEKLEQKSFTQERLYNDWLEKIEKGYPNYYDLKYNTAEISIKQLQKELNSQSSTLIEYFLGEEDLYIFVIDGDDIEVEKIKIEKQLFEDINTLNNCISTANYSYDSFNKFNESSYRLYNILLKKAIDNNWIENTNLIIIPDEQLNLIPFESLVTESQEFNDTFPHYHQLDYLVKDFDISYHYSSNLIKEKNKRKNKDRKSFLGIAPTFTGRNIQKLENNISEIQDAAAHYTDAKILQSDHANYKNILTFIKDYKTVHFATHAIFNDQIPLDSRIELADTSLYIYEIFGMEHHLDLAIMSACETASGKRRKGEGVISLSRAFIQSGCPSVIASLWSISDQKTSMLMKNFYDYFSEGKTAKSSLSEAKRKYISEAMSKNVHPFYWAGFIQIGTTEPDENSNIPFYYWLIGLVGILFIGIFFWRRKMIN